MTSSHGASVRGAPIFWYRLGRARLARTEQIGGASQPPLGGAWSCSARFWRGAGARCGSQLVRFGRPGACGGGHASNAGRYGHPSVSSVPSKGGASIASAKFVQLPVTDIGKSRSFAYSGFDPTRPQELADADSTSGNSMMTASSRRRTARPAFKSYKRTSGEGQTVRLTRQAVSVVGRRTCGTGVF